MKIIFMGTPDFAVPSLKAMVDARYEIAAVFTQPDRPKGRGNKLTPSPVKVYAAGKGIPVYQPEKIRKESVDTLRELAPDLYVTAAFGQILSKEILDIPKLGCINVHASLLPKHRGSAPIAWSMLQGDPKTGVTTMMTDVGIDTGDMLLKEETEISEKESCGELTERLSVLGGELLLKTLRSLEEGTLKRIPQNEQEMTYDPKLDKAMGELDWHGSAFQNIRKIHALNPWPACSVPCQGIRIKLLRAECAEGNGMPGEILTANPKDGLIVACEDGAVRITELQAPGGKAMKASDYLRGHPMQEGIVLKEVNQNG